MIICIIMFSILAIGILAFILKWFSERLYYHWRDEADKYSPDIKEYYWVGFSVEQRKNPNYNEKLYKKALKKKEFYQKINNEFLFGLGMVGCIGGGILSLIFSLVVLFENCFQSSNIKYLNMVETRSAYVRELETNPENELLYLSIADFNNSLREIKISYENPWTSWLYNSKIAQNIDYIEVK